MPRSYFLLLEAYFVRTLGCLDCFQDIPFRHKTSLQSQHWPRNCPQTRAFAVLGFPLGQSFAIFPASLHFWLAPRAKILPHQHPHDRAIGLRTSRFS